MTKDEIRWAIIGIVVGIVSTATFTIIGAMGSAFSQELREFFLAVGNGPRAAKVALLRARIRSYSDSDEALLERLTSMFIFACSMLLLIWGVVICASVNVRSRGIAETLITGGTAGTMMSGLLMTILSVRTMSARSVVAKAREKLKNQYDIDA